MFHSSFESGSLYQRCMRGHTAKCTSHMVRLSLASTDSCGRLADKKPPGCSLASEWFATSYIDDRLRPCMERCHRHKVTRSNFRQRQRAFFSRHTWYPADYCHSTPWRPIYNAPLGLHVRSHCISLRLRSAPESWQVKEIFPGDDSVLWTCRTKGRVLEISRSRSVPVAMCS